MKIRASTKLRGKGDIRDGKGVGHLVLTAESDDEREFVTCIYRILAGDGAQQEQGVATMRRFLSDFPAQFNEGNSAMTSNTEQPIPDTEGEWYLEHLPDGRIFICTSNQFLRDPVNGRDAVVVEVLSKDPRIGAQIVADHNSKALLVEALRDLVHQLPTDERLADYNLDRVEAALAQAAGVEEK